jgi:hypothetical protein
MASINEVVSEFNIGFFSTINNNKEHLNLDNLKDSEYGDFSENLKIISTEAYEPSPETRYLDGFDNSEPSNPVPTQIPITGYFQDSFLDEDGNWDEEAEYASYKEKELAYKKDVIDDWLKERGYDLQNSADLMKALLEKVG